MENKKLLVAIAACLLLTSCFAIPAVFSAQPPIDTTTYYVAGISSPAVQVDPARAYDTASGELIFNVYETLIFFAQSGADAPVVPDTNMLYPTTLIASLGDFKPVIATALPTISADGKIWTFTIASGHKFHPWTDHLGVVHANDVVTAADVVYSFQRMFVQDQSGSPQGMLALPSCGTMFFDKYDADALTNTLEPIGVAGQGEMKVAALIQNFCHAEGNNVIFNFSAAVMPATAIWCSFAQSWGSIVNKAFCIEHGTWDGLWTNGWSTEYRRIPSTTYSPLDQFYAKHSLYSSASSVPAMCGSGPYKFNYWDKANMEWRIDKFDDYNGGWEGNHVNTVINKGIPAWPTRKMMFLSGEFEVAGVPTANMLDVLDPSDTTKHTPIAGIRLYWGLPQLSNGMMFFTATVDPTSPYVPKVGGVSKPNLFNDTHVRKAFCYALNFTRYMAAAWYNEAVQPYSWWVAGLAPNYENTAISRYDINTAAIETELKAAGLWDSGFDVYAIYNVGNTARQLAAEGVRDTFTALGSRFKVTALANDWPVVLADMDAMKMPVWFIGWLADYPDPDNFVRAYMHTQGDFSMYQGYYGVYNATTSVDEAIDEAAGLPNGPARQTIYMNLQQIFHDDAVSLPLYQGVARRWQRDWVKGWYYNQIYPGGFYYDLYKAAPVNIQSVDLDVTHTITPTTPTYPVILEFHGAMRVGGGSTSAAKMHYDITVSRADSNTNLALLVTSVGLRRTNLTNVPPNRWTNSTREYPNSTYVLLAPGASATVPLDWSESTTMGPATWQVAGQTSPVNSNANDTNTANNVVLDGTVQAKELVGDITGNGVVDIFDAIQLSNAFTKKQGDTGWNADADLKLDLVIDIFDAILLAANFGKTVP